MTIWVLSVMVCQECGLVNYTGSNVCLNCGNITIPVILKENDNYSEDVADGDCR